ncbi:quaternary amine ABC transporter ATP-binding protein [Phyllobacterium endophyticum]|uniref:quaternary amine ABC transporter ATP-binding protein n=1 Tax=Phyllobacterium endophyticum TaxID=1149773 RepID=UPI00164F01CC|nr:glycine betaine/L-proline ABC transporter ATP-binding protein [Phyllobacterium endophyticum]
MTECLKIENLYKIFARSPDQAMQMLAAGSNKDDVLAKTGAVVGLNNVTLSVPAGAIYMIMGLSGSGKSTLARCINRLNEPSSGKILLDGEDLVPLDEERLREIRRTRISMVFQHFALLPNKRVIENTEFGLKLRGVPLQERRRRAEEVLSVVGLARWAYHFPHELSGGMRQRVGLARALATDADVLIMDEAFSALDPLIRTEMQDELLRLQRTFKKTILFITHDFQEALKLGTRIAIMSEGELVREGTPQQIVLEPGSDYVAAFTREIDRSRLFDARSIMTAAQGISQTATGSVTTKFAATGEPVFIVDADNRILGALSPTDQRRVNGGTSPGPLLSGEYVTVPANAKLVDVARVYRSGQPMAVIDESGKLIGTLAAEQILSRIAATSNPQPCSPGDQNV